ncbi:GNAT family N-acetyltransferase [Brevibacillus choshinensis]|uniref:GNAT family N-acetyltransferase n=1 Tax=Brevibacillus choshinensis TaxID=54911 RepID=A0ABX7FXA8_BRECH|nr:GNAT family N-acetyltransferase [Brevibacillus choshinensis]QRG70439.1 GNAT family N-acetyltransferase [Brevibacillus choshinensis]
MNIQLKPVTRDNWLEALELQVMEEQKSFVPTVAVSLAKVHIKPDGDGVEYLPFAIYHEESMVGFIMHAFEEETRDMYWINGFLIDASHQGRGYGKAALLQMIDYITQRFSQCQEVRLTVCPHNESALKLYRRTGFAETGDVYGGELVMRLPVTGSL